MDLCDLHIHSSKSDGLLSPKQIVDWGIRKGLRCISITDHDNVEGIEEAVHYVYNKDITMVPGIELSTEYKNAEVHILGYFIDYINPKLKSFFNTLSNARYERAKKMVEKLKNIGVNLEFDTVLYMAKDAANIGRPHIARALVDIGICRSIEDAFDRFLGFGKPAYSERYKISPFKAIEIIAESGGVSSVAHPGLIPNINTEVLIKKLRSWGLVGVEVYHSQHNNEDISNLNTIAKKYDLVVTGGSDCHGTMIDSEPILGSIGVPYSNVMELRKRAFKVNK